MIRIKDFSIKKKLIAIQLATTFIVILLFGVFLVLYNLKVYQNSIKNQMTSMAQIIGSNCTSSLNFLDTDAAEEILSSLKMEDKIENAWIVNEKGVLFAKYSKSEYTEFDFPEIKKENYQYKGNYIILSKYILQEGEIIGAVCFRLNTDQEWNVIQQSISAAVIAFLFGMIMAFGLSVLMQKTISKPILDLVKVGYKVIETGDYSVRVARSSKDEIGFLYAGFNEMLEQINIREMERDRAEVELQKAYDDLDVKVKERTKELAEANIRLKELDRLKSMFLASMSHELRTPLNSIIGFTGILLMGLPGELNEEQRKQLKLVKNSANHLLNMICDILDISKIEAAKVDVTTSEFNLHDIVNEVFEISSPLIKTNDLHLMQSVPDDLKLFSDQRRVKQVLMNLVSNAIKFTNKGTIKISANRLKNEIVEIRVKDSGIGIKDEDMKKLFNPFEQIDMSTTKIYQGTGLGLYLCKKLISLLGGEITATSKYGEYSEFIFSLPLKYKTEIYNEENSGG